MGAFHAFFYYCITNVKLSDWFILYAYSKVHLEVTANLPISPPLKNKGLTTKLSVVKANRPLGISNRAWSSMVAK
jgi:hypothetical protein